MSAPLLHPFARRYLVRYPRPVATGENQRMLTELLERIARACPAAGAALIGHIKAFASQPCGGYLTASVTWAGAPAQVEASGLQDDEQLEVHLAVLVYGLEYEQLTRIVAQTWQELASEGLLLSVQQLTVPLLAQDPKEQTI